MPDQEAWKIEAWAKLRGEEFSPDHPAVKEIPRSVYKVPGLSDVAEWYLFEKLEQSGLKWELAVTSINYLGSEQRTSQGGNTSTWYLVSAEGALVIDGRPFPAVGAAENMRVDAAFRGALTSLFKNGCRWSGITLSLWKGEPLDYGVTMTGQDESSGNTSRSASTLTSTVPNSSVASTQPTQVADSLDIHAEFLAKPENVEKIKILKDMNRALPRPLGGNWVTAAVGLFLSQQEKKELTEEMAKLKTPIAFVYSNLAEIHRKPEQCGVECSHVQEFYKKLSAEKC